MFSDKEASRKIILVENGEILSNHKHISECFNEYCINVTDTINITTHDNISGNSISIGPIVNAISKYVQHPSILLIRERTVFLEPFRFSPVYSLDVLNEINALNSGEKSSGPIPPNMLKCVSGVCYEELTRHINKSFDINTFPSNLKRSNVTPIYKAGDSTCKKNFQPISILSTLSKNI